MINYLNDLNRIPTAKQDALVVDYAKEHNLPYVILRPSVVFGPGKGKITDRIGSDTFGISLHLGLSNIIPLTYVDNCPGPIVLAALQKGIDGQVFNIVDEDLRISREFLKLYKRSGIHFYFYPLQPQIVICSTHCLVSERSLEKIVILELISNKIWSFPVVENT